MQELVNHYSPLEVYFSPVSLTVNLSAADSMNHQNSSYKFKSSNGVSGNNHLPGGVTGGGSYRQQRSGAHPLQQQPLNLSQVCETTACSPDWDYSV